MNNILSSPTMKKIINGILLVENNAIPKSPPPSTVNLATSIGSSV